MIDIVLLVIILLIGFKGFYDGFIHEVAVLIGIVVGIFVASRLAIDVGALFSQYIYPITSPSLCVILGFIIIIACFWIGFMILGFVLSKFIKLSETKMGFLDRILGYIFSCVKVFCVFSFIFFALNQIRFIKEVDFVKNLPEKSHIYDAMMDTASILVKFADSNEIAEKLNNAIHHNQVTEKIQKKISTEVSQGLETMQKKMEK